MDPSIEDKVKNFILFFTSIFWEALPFIVLGAIIAGILEEIVPQRFISRVLPRNRFLSILIGAFLGLVFPMCECGIIPIMRRLIRKGLPLSCCTAYLLAGPIINPVVMFSTFEAFKTMGEATSGGKSLNQMNGWWLLGFRVGLAYVVAVVTSLIVEVVYRKYGNSLLTPLTKPSELPLVEDEDEAVAQRRPIMQRIGNVSETALHDFIDITVFLSLGALLSALVRLWLTPDDIARIAGNQPAATILLMMGLAVILCLCSEADAFVAASYISLPPAPKLAFLVLGPMIDLKLYMMYTRVFRPRLIWTIFISVAVQVFVYTYLVHLFWEQYGPTLLPPASPGT